MLVNRKKRMITLPFDLDEKVIIEAKKDRRSVTSFIEKVLIDYIEKNETK